MFYHKLPDMFLVILDKQFTKPAQNSAIAVNIYQLSCISLIFTTVTYVLGFNEINSLNYGQRLELASPLQQLVIARKPGHSDIVEIVCSTNNNC